jgi:hypothetical protein
MVAPFPVSVSVAPPLVMARVLELLEEKATMLAALAFMSKVPRVKVSVLPGAVMVSASPNCNVPPGESMVRGLRNATPAVVRTCVPRPAKVFVTPPVYVIPLLNVTFPKYVAPPESWNAIDAWSIAVKSTLPMRNAPLMVTA